MKTKMAGRYSVLPARMYFDKRLKGKDELKTILGVLGIFIGGNGSIWCWPSRKTISEITGIAKPNVTRAINTLIEYGYIEKKLRKRPDGSSASNMYKILQDTDMDAINFRGFEDIPSDEIPDVPQGITHDTPPGITHDTPMNKPNMNNKKGNSFVFDLEEFKPSAELTSKIVTDFSLTEEERAKALKKFKDYWRPIIAENKLKADDLARQHEKHFHGWCGRQRTSKSAAPTPSSNKTTKPEKTPQEMKDFILDYLNRCTSEKTKKFIYGLVRELGAVKVYKGFIHNLDIEREWEDGKVEIKGLYQYKASLDKIWKEHSKLISQVLADVLQKDIKVIELIGLDGSETYPVAN
jgi:hypothetical protein